MPIFILVIYSFLGGFIFYTIESPEEQRVLVRKKEYMEREEQTILREILAVEQRIRALYTFHNATEIRNIEIRKFKTYAMNRINKVGAAAEQ